MKNIEIMCKRLREGPGALSEYFEMVFEAEQRFGNESSKQRKSLLRVLRTPCRWRSID